MKFVAQVGYSAVIEYGTTSNIGVIQSYDQNHPMYSDNNGIS